MSLSAHSLWLPDEVPPAVAEDARHGSVPQPSRVCRDGGGLRGSAKVAVPAGDGCPLPGQPL